MIKAIASPTVPPFFITLALGIFIFLFCAASVSYVLFTITVRPGVGFVTIIFIISELLCALLTTLALFVSRRYDPFVLFSHAPVEWVQNHRWLAVVFAGLFLPIFVFQIFAINRYSAAVSEDGDDDEYEDRTIRNAARRKATPYHGNFI
ncbi:hypothetical protein FO519_007994 [Halicephalobus sp. NKZ332]|nr:hypothetical protein FO519_007994 [Halicephalobus sp. NKZ332]